jgi:hypothetical protein
LSPSLYVYISTQFRGENAIDYKNSYPYSDK